MGNIYTFDAFGPDEEPITGIQAPHYKAAAQIYLNEIFGDVYKVGGEVSDEDDWSVAVEGLNWIKFYTIEDL